MYNKIIGPDQQNTNIKHAMIWILPKSANIFTSIFFKIYNLLLEGKELQDKDFLHSPIRFNAFEKETFTVGHAEFPGLERMETDPERLQQWNNLSYSKSLPWNSSGTKHKDLAEKITNLDPEFLDHCRIVLIFRNPLDQLLSHYKHYNQLPNDEQADAQKKLPISLEDLIFNKDALASYIKMFYTFHLGIKNFPEHILCIPYEELMHDKPAVLLRIIKYLDIRLDEALLAKTIELTSIENLKQIENKLDISLIGRRNKSRHIHNGGIGVWQDQMTPEMVHRIEAEFNKFDLSLKMFHLADELEPQFSFLMEDEAGIPRPKFRP